VTDQLGQPTWTRDLASAIAALLDADAPAGTYHGTNSGQASWFELARATFELAGLDPERVLPTDSSAFVRPAPRPAYCLGAGAARGAARLARGARRGLRHGSDLAILRTRCATRCYTWLQSAT
jgi:dTDP-4-dehydrorhamnose reductase